MHMTVADFWTKMTVGGMAGWVVGILLILLSLIQISPIKLIMAAGVYFSLKWINPGTDLLGCIIAVGIGIVWMGIYLGIIMRRRIIRQWKEE